MWDEKKAAVQRLGEVIRTDALTTSKGDFLITHSPFQTLSYNNLSTITEQELLNNYLLAPGQRDSHKFIMIQGGNGSGKTNLIRWLKEKYEAATDRSEEAVILISRAHNNLQDAMTQLLESGIFPEEVRDRTIKLLQNARGNVSVSDFKRLINFKFVLEIENDKSQSTLDQRTKDRLARYLQNPFILNTFLMQDGGPLDRIRARIETTDESVVVDGDAPVFLPEDFEISISQISTGLRRMDDKADQATIWMAEQFSNASKGRGTREAVANYLNTKVSAVIRSSMDLKSIDFQHIFEDLRKDLKRKGMSLTLFLEDINAFTGIDEPLIEALLVDHTGEGNEECCRLISVVGSTIWFYENKLNSSIRERISFNIYLREGSVISENYLDAFVARYVNAINLNSAEVDKWYLSGAHESEIPVVPSSYSFSEVEIGGKPYSLFPFTAQALNRLYNTLEIRDENNSSRTPRVVLNQIVQHILLQWFKKGPAFLSSESNFVNEAFSIPRWADETYEISNKALSDEYVVERSILLRIWGNGTTDRTKDAIGGVSRQIFDAFEIPFPDGEAYSPQPERVTPEPEPVRESSLPQSPKTDERLKLLIAEINEWNTNPKAVLRSHPDLRDDLVRFIMSNSPWTEWGIPFMLAEASIQRRFINIEGQSAVAQADLGITLSRAGDETRFLLLALAHWRYDGNSSWEFNNGLDYYTIAISWLENHKSEICDFITRTNNTSTMEELSELGVVAQYCLAAFSSGFKVSDSPTETMISMFKPTDSEPGELANLDQWNSTVLETKAFPELKNLALSFYRKSIGGRRAEDANYIFIDADSLLENVIKFLDNGCTLDAYDLLPEDESRLNTQFARLINLVRSRKTDIISEARHIANTYKSYFINEISSDLSDGSISKTVREMNDFLQYLSKQNSSYDHKLSISLNDPNLVATLSSTLEKTNSLLTCKDDAQLFSLLSEDPFSKLSSLYKVFVDFDRLLQTKESIFVKGINQELQSEIEKTLRETKSSLSTMQAQFSQFKEV